MVESVKAASDVYAPISGEVIEGNGALADAPELVNQDPYGAGWLMRLRPKRASDIGALMDADAYAKHLESRSELILPASGRDPQFRPGALPTCLSFPIPKLTFARCSM